MEMKAHAGVIPSPRPEPVSEPEARSVESDRVGAQAEKPMGFVTVLEPDAPVTAASRVRSSNRQARPERSSDR